MDCSFLGWNLLSLFTLGLINIFYANPYKQGARAELYLALREKALEEGADYCHVFTDRYLVSVPSEEVVRAALEREARLADTPDWKERAEAARTMPVFPEQEYTPALFTIEGADRRFRLGIDYQCSYGMTGIILLFFIFSVVGWCWEVGLHLVQSGHLVNRGVLHGPWLPIYGSGGVLVLILLKKVRERPVVTFFPDDADLRMCGVCYKLGPGNDPSRREMVGLQRIFPEPERTGLRGRTADFRTRRMRLHLYSGAAGDERLHQTDTGEAQGASLRSPDPALCGRLSVFRRPSQHRSGDYPAPAGIPEGRGALRSGTGSGKRRRHHRCVSLSDTPGGT